MIFPIGDQNVEGGYRPIVTYVLIALNTLVFGYQLTIDPADLNRFFLEFGAVPADILNGRQWYSLFSSIFLHGSVAHFLGNMLFLWVFADNIEAVAGHWRFLIFYLLGGLIAGLAHIAFNQTSGVPAIGASGSISAVLGTYLVFFPRSHVRVLVLFFFRSVYIHAIFFLGFWILLQLYSGIGSLNNVSGEGVAWWAHIGGFFFGVVYGLVYKRKMVQSWREATRDQLV